MAKRDGVLGIANYFISKGKCSNMKLNKLVYFAYAVYLAATDKNLISEKPHAWRHGPVFPRLYKEYNRICGTYAEQEFTEEDQTKDPEKIVVLRKVWEKFGGMIDFELSALTHKPGTPWHTTFMKKKKHGKLLMMN